ncbi:hypothetical protein HanRHA438_Chr14g0656121 [Helianthus annuus]|nr:hypothetical protein HanRHA438_Chr14g0656121 [Helianthus annuus]
MWWRWSRDGGGGRRRCWPTTVTKTANNKLECYLVASGSSPIRLESRLVARYSFGRTLQSDGVRGSPPAIGNTTQGLAFQ